MGTRAKKPRTIKSRRESISSRKKRNRFNPLQAELDKPLAKSLKEGLGAAAVVAGPGKFAKAGKVIKKVVGKIAPKFSKIARNRKTREAKINKDFKSGKITSAERVKKFKTASAKEKAAVARKADKVERVKKADVLQKRADLMKNIRPKVSDKARLARTKKVQESEQFKKTEEFFSKANIAKRSKARQAIKEKGLAKSKKVIKAKKKEASKEIQKRKQTFKEIQAEGKARKRTGSQPRGTFGPSAKQTAETTRRVKVKAKRAKVKIARKVEAAKQKRLVKENTQLKKEQAAGSKALRESLAKGKPKASTMTPAQRRRLEGNTGVPPSSSGKTTRKLKGKF